MRYAPSNRLKNNPELLAEEHLKSGDSTTALVINKILSNQARSDISVTDIKLKKLLRIKGVEIYLPVVTSESKKLLTEITGVSKYKGNKDVYVFMEISRNISL